MLQIVSIDYSSILSIYVHLHCSCPKHVNSFESETRILFFFFFFKWTFCQKWKFNTWMARALFSPSVKKNNSRKFYSENCIESKTFNDCSWEFFSKFSFISFLDNGKIYSYIFLATFVFQANEIIGLGCI